MTKKRNMSPIQLRGSFRERTNPTLDIIRVKLQPRLDLMLEGGVRYQYFDCVQDYLDKGQ